MASKQVILLLCGIHSLALAVFHCFFWRIFYWKTELPKLSAANRAVMQILNTRLIYLFLFLAFLCFVYPEELIDTKLGRVILVGFSIFWIGRSIEQFVFLRKLKHPMVHVLTLIFFIGAVLFILPVLINPA